VATGPSPGLDWLVSHEQIRQLVYRYALAVDSRDLDLLVSLFVDDVQVGRDEVGRDALRAFFDRSLREIGTSILQVTNVVVDLDDPDHARGTVYCRGEIEVGDQWVVQAIQYRDRYERRGGQWYFVRRRHLLWYGADVLQRPLGLPPADWPANHTGKGELPEAWDTWQRFWA
jgi:ketosteroid isomerase-like protein